MTLRRCMIILLSVLFVASVAMLQTPVPQTKPNDVIELVPGVYFRHGDLLGQGHCNNGFVLFDDFVLVIDGNFPNGAEACMADIKKITNKPVRFVFDTHHHGDHVYGNRWWMNNGVLPIAHEGVVSEMKRGEPQQWLDTAKGREDVRRLNQPTAMPPILTYSDRMVIDDGKRRIEFYYFGIAHTQGDGFAYLPKAKILFTGDAVVNGPYNYMGGGDSESWIKVIEQLQQLDVEIVAPGHGPCAGKELLEQQKQYFLALRQGVAKGIKEGKSLADIQKSIQIPDAVSKFKGDFFPSQIEKIYKEMRGL